MPRNVNLQRIDVIKEAKKISQINGILSESDVQQTLIELIKKGASQDFNAEKIVAIAAMKKGKEKTRELRKMKRQVYVEKILQEFPLLQSLEKDLLSMRGWTIVTFMGNIKRVKKLSFVEELKRLLEKRKNEQEINLRSIIIFTKKIQSQFIRDCKLIQKEHSRALNIVDHQTKIQKIIETLLDPRCHWGSREADTLIQDFILFSSGQYRGKTIEDQKLDVLNTRRQKVQPITT